MSLHLPLRHVNPYLPPLVCCGGEFARISLLHGTSAIHIDMMCKRSFGLIDWCNPDAEDIFFVLAVEVRFVYGVLGSSGPTRGRAISKGIPRITQKWANLLDLDRVNLADFLMLTVSSHSFDQKLRAKADKPSPPHFEYTCQGQTS